MAATSGVLVAADHAGVDADGPLDALDPVDISAQLVKDTLPGTVG